MPHFGLMDEDALGPVEGPLQRAKLHIRCGRRRLKEGKVSMGILTLYDALNSALQWYVASPGHGGQFSFSDGEDGRDEKTVYDALVRSAVLDGKFSYEELNGIVEKSLDNDMKTYDYHDLLSGIESVMTQLGVMPFDENELPPEDPSTP